MREAVNLRKPKSGALADRLGREERIEYLAQYVWSDAGAGILHADGDIVAGIFGSLGSDVTRAQP